MEICSKEIRLLLGLVLGPLVSDLKTFRHFEMFRHEFEVAQKTHDDVLQKQAEKLELSQKENSEMKIEIDNLRLQVAQEWFLFSLTK